MSENINDLCGTINGRPIAGYHRVLYGETQEYLESLAEAGYILMYSVDNPAEEGKLTVAKPNAMPEYLKDYATNVVYDEYGNFISCSVEGLITLAEDNTATDVISSDVANLPENNIDLLSGEELAAMQDALDSYVATEQEGTTIIQNHLYPGVKIHMVQYGETQEYLESLQDEGYLLGYNKDNPPEEGKLTISKPNPDPGTITFVANPTDTLPSILQDPADTTGADPAGLIAGMKSYLEEIAPKMSDIDSLTDEEVASFNETLKSFKDALRQAGVATYLADTTLDPRTDTGMNPETFDPRTDTSLNDLLDSYIAALDEKEAKTADTTGADTTTPDKNNLPTGDVIDENEKAFLNQILEKARAGISKNENNLPTGYIVIDPMPDSVKEKIIVAIEAYNKYPKMDPLDDDLPSGYVFTTEYTEEFEEKLKKAIESYFNAPTRRDPDDDRINGESETAVTVSKQDDDLPSGYVFTTEYTEEFEEKLKKAIELYFNTPARRDPDDTRVAFISTVDAETEAVTSVQVACAEDDGWRTVGVLNNPDGIDWKYQAGNLTGSGAASVVWHAQELGALGVWTDGTDNWTGIAGWFDANWTMLGCGDFDGDGKDSVLMSLNSGLFYSVDLDGTLTSLGGLNWFGWEFGAAGDFAGDGKTDVVLFHRESGAVVLFADGNADNYKSIGQLDASDWSVAGVRDFDGDGIDDLLVHQDSTGLIGGYAGADMNQWSVIDSNAGYYLA